MERPAETRYARLSEDARERHRERNRSRKQRLRADRIVALQEELAIAGRIAEPKTHDELVEAALSLGGDEAHALLKQLKSQLKLEVELRMLRYETPFFGPESEKMAKRVIANKENRLEKRLVKVSTK